MKNNISHVTTTAVRTWLIFMCYDIKNHFIGNATDSIMNIITNRAKIPRDAFLKLIFKDRPGGIIEVNELLSKNGMEMLRTSGVQE